MTSKSLTNEQTARRRQLAIDELLNAYQVEYVELLKEMGRRYRKLKAPLVNELSEVQKLLVQVKYNDLIKGGFQTQQKTASELTEMSQLGVPVLSGTKLLNEESTLMSFAQAETFLLTQTASTVRSSSRLSPHLSTSSPQLTDLDSSPPEAMEPRTSRSALADKMEDVHRLEEICCTASNREMDRSDCIATVMSEKGRFLIRQSSFTVGRSPASDEKQSCVDVNLSVEDPEQNTNDIYAIVWVRPDGAFHIKNLAFNEIAVDGKQVIQQHKSAPLANMY